MSASLVTIPLCQLKPSKSNMRKTDKLAGIEELAASIHANGLLENLVVHPMTNGNDPSFEVVAGGRRLAALKRLVKTRKIETDHPVACLVVEDASGVTLTELSLTENFERVPPHPADQFEAFAKLIGEDMSADDIAARFGVTPTFVQQRLKLASVSPKLIAEYRSGAMTLEQLTAFTMSDDRKVQESIWFDSPYEDMPAHMIRRLLTRSKVEASDRRARYVGLKAYEEAGGVIVRDLFDLEHEGYLSDSQLLDRLVAEKLQAEAETIRGEGWSWIEVLPETDYGYPAPFGRIAPSEITLAADEEERLKTLGERYDELVAIVEDNGEDGVGEELDRVTAEIEALQARKQVWRDEDKSRAGAILSFNQDGNFSVTRGIVRRERGDDGQEEPNPSRPQKPPRPSGYSESVLVELSAHRTAALREVLAGRPDIAFLVLLHVLESDVFADGSFGCVQIALTETPLDRISQTLGESKASQALLARHTPWAERLPTADDLWDWLLGLEETERLDLLAYCVAVSVNAIRTPDRGRLENADVLARLVGLDMADWWMPSEAFFRSLTKADILAAVAEGSSSAAANRLTDLKKDGMAKEAEQLLAGSRWIPSSLKRASEVEEPAVRETNNKD